MGGNITTVRFRQHGQILKAFAGCRFHRGGTVSGIVGNVLCFGDVVIGDPHDGRRGKTVTPDYFGGSVTLEIMDPRGNVVTRFGLATKEAVESHPNRRATKYGR